jgi:hypothetical protein
MNVGYSDSDGLGPSSSLPSMDDPPRGRAPVTRQSRARGSSRGRGPSTAALVSRKRKRNGRSRSLKEPGDVRTGCEIAKAVGRSKKLVIDESRWEKQSSIEMVVPV